jgi:hypothetical protein
MSVVGVMFAPQSLPACSGIWMDKKSFRRDSRL